jgi:nucleoside-diphosphate-sugar epimerase
MHVVLIGGTGHVGTYLVPRLVEAGHRVTVMSRGRRKPYQDHPAWARVEYELMDREAEERAATFAGKVAELSPDAVIDMICFTPESARHLVEGIRGRVRQVLFCGTIWVHGPSVAVPTLEHENIRPFGEYGIQKARMREFLLDEARRTGLPISLLHPGHIVGPGWPPVNPLGNFNPSVFTRIARGELLSFPTQGLETVHHVHADDVAQIFQRSLENWSQAAGEEFHAVSEQAITLRGYAEAVAAWFGREANLEFSGTDAWKQGLSEEDMAFTWDHLLHSPNCSIEKAKRCLGFAPRYTSLQAVREALTWLVEQGMVSR